MTDGYNTADAVYLQTILFQILPVSDDPTKVLRTKTKGIGTDNYRAPEVNAGLHSYDPSAADIWSLGVTLFFLVINILAMSGTKFKFP